MVAGLNNVGCLCDKNESTMKAETKVDHDVAGISKKCQVVDYYAEIT